jgi:hypothetical protein
MAATPHDVEALGLAGAGRGRIDRIAPVLPRQQEHLASWTHRT